MTKTQGAERNESLYIRVYFVLEALLYVAIQYAQEFLAVRPMKNIMYASIVVNTVMALWLYAKYGRREVKRWDNLLALGLAVNCVADAFLTLIGGEAMQIPGYISFCTVEAVYAVYLKPDRKNLTARVIVLLALWLFAWGIHLFTFANAAGLLNISLLSVNVFAAWAARRRNPDRPSLLFALALTSFLVGDISVGAELFLTPGTLPYVLVEHAVWIFYVPAQVLILLTYYARIRRPALESGKAS